METTIEKRLNDLEKQVVELTAKVLRLTPPAKDWRRTVGMLVDDELYNRAVRTVSEVQLAVADMRKVTAVVAVRIKSVFVAASLSKVTCECTEGHAVYICSVDSIGALNVHCKFLSAL